LAAPLCAAPGALQAMQPGHPGMHSISIALRPLGTLRTSRHASHQALHYSHLVHPGHPGLQCMQQGPFRLSASAGSATCGKYTGPPQRHQLQEHTRLAPAASALQYQRSTLQMPYQERTKGRDCQSRRA